MRQQRRDFLAVALSALWAAPVAFALLAGGLALAFGRLDMSGVNGITLLGLALVFLGLPAAALLSAGRMPRTPRIPPITFPVLWAISWAVSVPVTRQLLALPAANLLHPRHGIALGKAALLVGGAVALIAALARLLPRTEIEARLSRRLEELARWRAAIWAVLVLLAAGCIWAVLRGQGLAAAPY